MHGGHSFDIETLLNESQPQSILIVGDAQARDLTEEYARQMAFLKRSCEVTVIDPDRAVDELEGRQRFDLGIVIDALERMEKTQAGYLIARLRDLYTARFCALVPIGTAWAGLRSYWEPSDLYAFGMSLVNRYQEGDKPLDLYKFDIATYKKTPDWLNAKDWANPQLWDKYRW